MMKKLITAAILAITAAALANAHADDLTVSGFATITAGKAFDGWEGDFYTSRCPCYIGNYEHGAVYDKRELSLDKESLIGLQAKYKMTDKLSGTVQMVVRASDPGKPDVDWAYLSYDVTPETTVQVGRRRLPIYAYSDSVYIGYTLPWVRVPQDIYGWEVGAYNGVNVRHTTSVGDWAVTGNVFAGRESTHDNLEQKNIYYGYPVDDTWKGIVGGYLDATNDVFGFRVMYMQNKIDLTLHQPGMDPVSSNDTRQRILGLSASMDYGNWLVRAEGNTFKRPSLDFDSTSWTVTTGYKWGKFTPIVGYSSYKEKITPIYTAAQIDTTRFFGVRWDFTKNMDLKLQYDKVIDRSTYSFTNDSKMVTMSMDVVF